VTLASHPPGESPKSANASHLLQNMSLNRVEDFFIADVGTPGADVATLLQKHEIKWVPIVKDGKIVGIVSRANR
jgi:CBS domain-containing protein